MPASWFDSAAVLGPLSLWIRQNALDALGAAAVVAVAALVWAALLQRRLRQQTLQIRHSEERFRSLAERDALTGLVPRSLLHERLHDELESARRRQRPLALFVLDVDRLKQVNDSLGHAAGDEILRVAAQRVLAAVRDTDTVARISGDEFLVLLPGVQGRREAERIAAKIVDTVGAPVFFRGHEVPTSVSVGISTYPDGGDDATSLVHNGDAAMHEAKALGGNCYRFCSPAASRSGPDQLEIAVGLHRALAHGEFVIHYQPLVDLRTGEIDGVEALLRWRHERWGLVAPGEFIPLAEESGLIVTIGEWVLRESCRQIGRIEAKLERKLLLSVNVSPRQMQHGDLTRTVREVLRDCDREAANLELEITERILVGNSDKTVATFQRLRGMGARLAIDDFGTGFANLSYIAQFEVDRLKIDRSFIQHCLTERNSATVTRVIIAMAQNLDVSVVAEGIETADQSRFLQEAGCGLAQGNYFSVPVPAEELEEMLLRRLPWEPWEKRAPLGSAGKDALGATGARATSVSAAAVVNSGTLEELQR